MHQLRGTLAEGGGPRAVVQQGGVHIDAGTLADLNAAFDLQGDQGFAQRRPGDAQQLRQVARRWQAGAGLDGAFADMLAQAVRDLLVELSFGGGSGQRHR